MQIDHVKPKASQKQIGWTIDRQPIYEDIDHINNLMPSCRYCNNYKGGNDMEGFRFFVKNLANNRTLMFASESKGRVLEGFGIVIINQWDGKFYFERQQSNPMKTT